MPNLLYRNAQGQSLVVGQGANVAPGWTLVGPASAHPKQPSGTATTTGKSRAAAESISRALEQYQPGGGFGKGVEAGLERGRVKAMASGMQHLVGAGLAGTTMAGGLGKRYEEEVGMPARARVEEQRAQAISGIRMTEAGMEFQAGQAGTQMGFQAGQAGQQRDLQRYMADLQATLQREQMASRGPTMTAPTGRYAQQFPSIYGQEEQVPNWMGNGSAPSGSPQALWEAGKWEQSLAGERRRAGPEGLYGTTFG